jgi:hypothetical protein
MVEVVAWLGIIQQGGWVHEATRTYGLHIPSWSAISVVKDLLSIVYMSMGLVGPTIGS